MPARTPSNALADVAEKIESFGPAAYLITTGDGGAPHVVSLTVAWDGDELVADVGSRTWQNAHAHPSVTLLWPAGPGGDYSLIIDGRARAADGRQALVIRPERVVLHRLPTADPALPSCVPIPTE